MRRYLLHLLCTLVIPFWVGCSEKDNSGTENILPEQSQLLIRDYFPGTQITKLEVLDTPTGVKYMVTLSDQTEIDFETGGDWIRILATYPLPDEIFAGVYSLEAKRDVIDTLYNNPDYIGIESFRHGYKLTLGNGKEVFVGYIEKIPHFVANIITIYDLPESIQSFLINYISYKTTSVILECIEKEYKFSYRIVYDDDTYISFDKELECVEIDYYSYYLDEKIYNAFPESVVKSFKETYPNSPVRAIHKINDLYIFRISTNETVVIDPENGIMLPPTEEVEKFIDTHFTLPDTTKYSIGYSYTLDKIYIIYNYLVEEGVVYLHTDLYGEWLRIRLIQPAGNFVESIPLPNSIIKLLPSKLQTFLKDTEPYKNMSVTYVVREDEQIYINLNNSYQLLFDKDGNFTQSLH